MNEDQIQAKRQKRNLSKEYSLERRKENESRSKSAISALSKREGDKIPNNKGKNEVRHYKLTKKRKLNLVGVKEPGIEVDTNLVENAADLPQIEKRSVTPIDLKDSDPLENLSAGSKTISHKKDSFDIGGNSLCSAPLVCSPLKRGASIEEKSEVIKGGASNLSTLLKKKTEDSMRANNQIQVEYLNRIQRMLRVRTLVEQVKDALMQFDSHEQKRKDFNKIF